MILKIFGASKCPVLNVLFTLVCAFSGNTKADLFDQAKIFLEDGHLTIAAQTNKNLTLKTTGAQGGIYLKADTPLTEDHLPKLSSALGGVSAEEAISRDARISDLEQRFQNLFEVVNGEPSIPSKVQALETQVQDLRGQLYDHGSSAPSIPAQINSLKQQVRRLKRGMRNLLRQLNEDHCTSNPCRHGGTCISTYNSFHCRCPENWEGPNCDTDVNECEELEHTDLGCQNGATCQNTDGGYTCHCPPDYHGIHCNTRSNDCTSGSNQELCGHGTCINNADNGYECICDQGWSKVTGTRSACVTDVDECTSGSPPCSRNPPVACINIPGSFRCGLCPSGYTGNGFNCQDVNECMANNGGCSTSPMVACINTRGGVDCGDCPPGYQASGRQCNYVGPCHISNGGCSPMAVCVANSGYVQCFCRQGYTGNGVGAVGCLPGSSGGGNLGPVIPQPTSGGVLISPCRSIPCQHAGTCIPLASSFICNCAAGWMGNRCQTEKNECDSNPCLNGATCTDRLNSFDCTCTDSFEGRNCENEREVCGGYKYNENGTIRFPSGTQQGIGSSVQGMDCSYRISTTSGKVMNITFTEMRLRGPASYCPYDWVKIHDGPNNRAPIIARFCGSQIPPNVTSTHNYLFLDFHFDDSVLLGGRYFGLTWTSFQPECGAIIRDQEHGSFNSPGYPARYPNDRDCSWTIFANYGKRITFHFATLNIEHHPNCSYDFLKVYDGALEMGRSSELAKYCGLESEIGTPQPVTSSSHIASVHFHTDESVSGTSAQGVSGFMLTWSETQGVPGCGGLLTSPGTEFRSPLHPETYQHNLDCEWLIRVPRGDKVKLTFLSFNVENHANCRYDFVEVHEGNDEDAPLVGRYCGTTLPAEHVSSGNEVFVRFKTDHSVSGTGFRIRYDLVCGGEFTNPSGVITSPYYPDNYPSQRTCTYVISQPPGSVIRAQFLDFDVEGSQNCNYDYIQIRDGPDLNSTILGKYCGDPSLTPSPIVSSLNYLNLIFVTDGSVTNRGFKLNYTTEERLCGGYLKDATSGTIESPTDPNNYPHGVTCVWVIAGSQHSIIRLTWDSFAVESHSACNYDSVTLYDGNRLDVPLDSPDNSSTALQIGRYCGTTLPPQTTTFSNMMTVIFRSDSSISHEGFSASYRTFDSREVCGGNYFTSTGVIHSPGWPNNYAHLMECQWVINAPINQQIELNFTRFSLENHTNCDYDFLEVYNGGYVTSPKIGRFCGNRIYPIIKSDSNIITIKFRSDNSLSAPGFEILWDGTTIGCGGELTSSTGAFTSPNYPLPYHHNAECTWKISVSQGSRIQLVFVDINLENSPTCSYDYVDVYDGSRMTDTKIGRYCQSSHFTVASTSNFMLVKFRSDYSGSQGGFHVRYFADCNNLIEARDMSSGIIESPNFPDPYPHNRNCTWTIKAPLGNNISATFSHFHVEEPNHRGCIYDYVEFNQTRQYPPQNTQLAHYCGEDMPNPRTITTTTDRLLVRFLSDYSVAGNGFRLEWRIQGCGGLLTKDHWHFTSPNYPRIYPNSVECVWRIQVPLGKKIILTIEDFDIEPAQSTEGECYYDHLTVYGGSDRNSPQLTQLCAKQTEASVVTSQGSNMLVAFYSDGSVRGKGFHAHYSTTGEGCGGAFTTKSGTIHSKNYPNTYDDDDDCGWLITVDFGHIVQLTYNDFDLEHQTNCSYDYVALYDGPNDTSPLITKNCGQNMPNPDTYSSTGNQMYVRLMADGSVAGKGFKANYSMGCGATIVTDGSGELTSPNYPHPWNQGGNCSWTIIGASSGDHVSLQFTHLDLNNWGARQNCSLYSLKVFDGRDLNSPLVGSYCSRQIPHTITSQGNALHLNLFVPSFSSMTLFRALYSVELSTCGGDLVSEEGRFASPGYPNNYPDNAECIWRIGGAPGNKVRVTFLWYDIVETDGCNGDYVEIHENSEEGNVIGHYCGSAGSAALNSIISSASDANGGSESDSLRNATGIALEAETLWIKFNSDQSGTSRGFVAYYYLVHGNELSGTSGTIASPMYPHPYRHIVTSGSGQDTEITWRITVSEGKAIRIRFDEFEVQWTVYDTQDCSSYLAIHDGYDATAQEVMHSCGNTRPVPIVSSSNVLFIRLSARGSAHGGHDPGSKFKLQWQEIPLPSGGGSGGSSSQTGEGCRYYINVNSSITTIKSPGYPRRYQNNMDCTWIITSDPATRIRMSLSYISVEGCRYDYVEIYDGLKGSLGPWNKTATLCRRSQRGLVYFSSGEAAKIRFVTDGSWTRYGFKLKVQAVCGGYLTANRGLIKSPKINETMPNYPPNITCQWVIEARRGRIMKLTFTNVDILSSNTECHEDYLMLRNGGTPTSPLLLMNPAQGDHQNGRICGSGNIPNIRNTSSNLMNMNFVSNGDTSQGSGFTLEYEELGFGCGGHVYLRDSLGPNMEVHITSPNHPATPPPHSECIWIIMAPAGKEVQFDLPNRFDLTPGRGCRTAGLEIRDGGTEHSPLLGLFCGDRPHTQKSTGNTMYVRYYTNSNNPKLGFYAKASIARCGGTIRVSRYGNTHIHSPNYPSPYGSEQFDCEWNVVGPIGHYLTFSFPDIRLPPTMNCSQTDFIQIKDSPELDPVSCGYRQAESCAECTAGYGSSYCSGDCEWHDSSSSCVMTDEARDRRAEVLGTVCHWHHSHNNGTIDSASHHAIVRFKTDSRWTCSSCKFSIQVNASVEGCDGFVDARASATEGSSGIIQSPNYPNGLAHRIYCSWHVVGPDDRRIKVEVEDLDMPEHTAYVRNGTTYYYCRSRLVMYSGSHWHNSAYLGPNRTYCGTDQNIGPLKTSGNTLSAYLSSWGGGGLDHRGFKLRWSADEPRVCGGTITNAQGLISSPRNSSNMPYYPSQTSCHWSFRPNTGANGQPWAKTTVFKADRIRMAKFTYTWSGIQNEWCGSRLMVKSGTYLRPRYLHSGWICGQIDEPTIIRSPYRDNDVMFKTNRIKYSPPDLGFNMTYQIFNCGGTYSGPTNIIKSNNYPSQYPENTDCVWLLEYPEGEQIVIPSNEVTMDLEPESDNQCSDSTPNYVEIRNGGEAYSPLLWRGCGNSMPQTIRSMSNKLWIVFHSGTRRTTSQTYRGFQFRAYSSSSLGEYGGCGGYFHGEKGNISSPLDTSHPEITRYPNNVECIWYIEVKPSFHIDIRFYGRFEIETASGCSSDYLIIEEKLGNSTNNQIGANDYRQIGSKMCGRTLPANISSDTEKVRITFRTNTDVNGDGFKIFWERKCGETFYGGSGLIMSPNYPDKYDPNLNCEYRFEASPNDYVQIDFLEPFEIERGYNGRCYYDWVTVKQTWNGVIALPKRCGADTPPMVNTRGSTVLTFITDSSYHMKGFSARFKIQPCGGNITEETEIASPMNNDRYHHHLNCVWNITAPDDRVVGIKFNRLDLEGSSGCHYDHVSAFNGLTTNRSYEIGRYCGNQTNRSPPMMISTNNVMTVQFKTDGSITRAGFHAVIRFTYGPQQGCGGDQFIRGTSSKTIQSHDANNDGKYENEMDCQWLMIGDAGKALKLTFTTFNLEAAGTNPSGKQECFDFVEIRDGKGPADPLIGKLCGSQSMSSPFTTAGNFMWIRFSTDSTTGPSSNLGFTARIESTDPVCGSHLTLNATSSAQTIQSPGYPANYPSNTRCQWIIEAPPMNTLNGGRQERIYGRNQGRRIYMKFDSMDIGTQSASTLCSDSHIAIKDHLPQVSYSSRVNNRSMIISSQRNRGNNYRYRYLDQDVQYCGQQLPHEFFSQRSMVKINFNSGMPSGTTHRGFKLQYSLASCNRTYDTDNGRILNPSYPYYSYSGSSGTVCEFGIHVPNPQSKISVYFKHFYIRWSRGNCTETQYLKVYDGNSTSSPLLATLCGTRIPPTIHSTGRDLFFRFSLTGSSRWSPGAYDLTYTSSMVPGTGCGGSVYNVRGVVTSPTYPTAYTENSDCRWNLKVPDGHLIAINFRANYFGQSDDCTSNFLELYDVQLPSRRQLVSRYCQNDAPANHIGVSNKAMIRFVTNTNNTAIWRAQFQVSTQQGGT